MTSAREYMAADFARLLEDEGGVRLVDGADLLSLCYQVELVPGTFERQQVERCRLSFLAGATASRFIGSEVVVDGVRWRIVSLAVGAVSVVWLLERGVV